MDNFLKTLSKGEKRATIDKSTIGFTVNLFLDNKLYEKRVVATSGEAEDLAENFVIGDFNDPQLLNE